MSAPIMQIVTLDDVIANINTRNTYTTEFILSQVCTHNLHTIRDDIVWIGARLHADILQHCATEEKETQEAYDKYPEYHELNVGIYEQCMQDIRDYYHVKMIEVYELIELLDAVNQELEYTMLY